MRIGRGNPNRGIGGKNAKLSGFKKTGTGANIGGNIPGGDPGKGRQSKNMGSGVPKYAGPKFGRDKNSRSY